MSYQCPKIYRIPCTEIMEQPYLTTRERYREGGKNSCMQHALFGGRGLSEVDLARGPADLRGRSV